MPDFAENAIMTLRFIYLQLLGNMVLSSNLEYTNPKSTDVLKDGSEIAFIPPIRYVAASKMIASIFILNIESNRCFFLQWRIM